jgi:RecA-family ATPase
MTNAPGALTELRLRLLENGHTPLPAVGKQVLLPEWSTRSINATDVRAWETAHRGWRNTGIRGPALDVDIKDPEAAEAVRQEVNDWFGDRGVLLRRVGKAPKFLVPFRVKAPFGVINQGFEAPNGEPHLIQFLCAGQQFIAAGDHPETTAPYSWCGGRDLTNTPYSELPEIDEVEARELVTYLGDLLVEKFGYKLSTGPKPNGRAGCPPAGGHSPGDFQATDGRLDVDALLAAMPPSGAGADEAQPRVLLALAQQGLHPDDIVEKVVDATMDMAARNGLGWDREIELRCVHSRFRHSLKVLHDEYDPSTGVIPSWLHGDFHEAWAAALVAGKRPQLTRNKAGWYIRAYGGDEGESKKDGSKPGGKPGDKPSNKPGKRLILRPFEPFNVATLPPRSWLYGKHYQRRTVSLTAGPGGMGKSSLDLVEAIAMATARNLLGEQPEERLRVWYHNGEDPFIEIMRRVAAICQHYSIPQEELPGYLFITSGNEFPLRVAKGYASLEIDVGLLGQISACVADREIDIAVFDPLVTLHSVSEIDTGKMDTVIRLFAGIADENDAAIELAHHVRKPAAGVSADYDVNDIRGVTAITDAVRAARLLNRMNEKDAEAAGCDEKERLSRFRVDRAKGNYSPPQAATWRQFINIELPNSDEVGVVASWDFPGQGELTPGRAAADQKAEQVFLALLDKFLARGQNVSANSGPTHAPSKFADEQEARKAKVSKAALKAAMSRLLDTGRIRAEPTGRGDRSSHRLIPWQGTP